MTRRYDGQQICKSPACSAVRRDDELLLARMRGGGGEQRAAADRGPERGERAFFGRRRRRVELEIAGDHGARGAQRMQPLRIHRRAREHQIEAVQQVADRARQQLPAAERALRQPRIDQRHRHAARGGLDQRVRPQFGFDEQRELWPPVLEKARGKTRHVERHELMDDAGGQALRGDAARRDRAGGDEHAVPARAEPLDQRQHAEQFADARAVQPDQWPVRPREGGDAAALVDARADLLAAAQPLREQHVDQRFRGRRKEAIGGERGRQPLAHGASLPRLSAIS